MKCPSCGANLQIEDEKCPFCGKENPFAVKHRRDMHYYNREFHQARQSVEQKTERFTSSAVKITVIAVLLTLNIIMAFLTAEGPYQIWKMQTNRDIQKNYEAYEAQLAAYEEEGNWCAMEEFYEAKSLSMGQNYHEYRVVVNAANSYKYIMQMLMNYASEEGYIDARECGERVADSLDYFYAYIDRTEYQYEDYDICYEGRQGEALERMRADMEAVLIAYAHMTPEEVQSLADYSKSKKTSLIEEGLLR